jgi:hypothetical protein
MMVIAGAFLCGGAVGYAAQGAVAKPAPAFYDAQDELARELALDESQRRFVDSVWAWRRARSREIMATVRPALDSVRDSARVLMINSFDSTQTAAFRRLIERNERIADSVARARGERR